MATSVVVISMLVMALILGVAYYTSVSAEAREEHRRLLGEQTEVLVRNMVTEAFYAVFTRINSPSESRRFKPDVYARLRSLKPGQKTSFDFQPFLAWRTATQNGFQLKPVRVTLTLKRIDNESYSAGWKARRSTVIPAGVRRRSCYTRGNWVPDIRWRQVGVGELRLEATAQISGSERTPVVRNLETAYPFRSIKVSNKPEVKWVDLIPIQAYQMVSREVKM